MKATPKKRLCWNCEGNVPVNLENCPYCSVYLSTPSAEEAKEEEDEHTPPYRLVSSADDQKVPASPFSALESADPKEENQAKADPAEAAATMNEMKVIALPLVLLLAGSICFLFSLLMLLFSEGGLLTLQWNGSFWYIYLLIALPMLYFGWHSLQHVDKDEHE